MLKHGIKESLSLDLSLLWSYGDKLSHTLVVADKKKRFLSGYNRIFISTAKCAHEDFLNTLAEQISIITRRGSTEKAFWENEKTGIHKYSREQAIKELIRAKKIDEKIQQIEQYVGGLRND